MRAPATFVVARHLLAHPDDSGSKLARHCNLSSSSANLALKRIRENDLLTEGGLLHVMQQAAERPHHQTFSFRAPDPEQWLQAYTGPRWISGEFAAEQEGFDIVPERLLVYVQEQDLPAAQRAALHIFGRIAAKHQANLIIRIADPWLHLDPSEPLIERGQRLLDYNESRHIQILRSLRRD